MQIWSAHMCCSQQSLTQQPVAGKGPIALGLLSNIAEMAMGITNSHDNSQLLMWMARSDWHEAFSHLLSIHFMEHACSHSACAHAHPGHSLIETRMVPELHL